jgi:hypothetical protein
LPEKVTDFDSYLAGKKITELQLSSPLAEKATGSRFDFPLAEKVNNFSLDSLPVA